jgi:hypothetical protein
MTGSLQAISTGRLGIGGQQMFAGNRDPYYKSKNKTGLRDIKGPDDLEERLHILQANSDLLLAQVESNLKAVLLRENSYDSAGTYASCSPHLKISHVSLDAYVSLHMHLMNVTLSYCGWEYARMELEHHTKKLATIRSMYQTRLQIVCHVYCYLRDQCKSKWQSFDIQSLQLHLLMGQFEDCVMPNSCPPIGGLSGCMHCKSNLHVGCCANCPWTPLSSKKAQSCAKAASQAEGCPSFQ